VTGPQHYAYAEQLLDFASEDEAGSPFESYHLRAAQVHATLALAAAAVDALVPSWREDAWKVTQ
jgi:hypothetical protein